MDMVFYLIAAQTAIPSFVLVHSEIVESILRRPWSWTILMLTFVIVGSLVPDNVFRALLFGMVSPAMTWVMILKIWDPWFK